MAERRCVALPGRLTAWGWGRAVEVLGCKEEFGEKERFRKGSSWFCVLRSKEKHSEGRGRTGVRRRFSRIKALTESIDLPVLKTRREPLMASCRCQTSKNSACALSSPTSVPSRSVTTNTGSQPLREKR